MTEITLPIDLASHLFDVRNTWVVLGVPDNDGQHLASLRRKGLGSQINWSDYSEAVLFDDREFEPGHPLFNARRVQLATSAPIPAAAYPMYDLRRQQLLNLNNLGLRLSLGASSDDFLNAASEAFKCGGLLSVIAHFECDRGFEFTDGFLAVDDLPRRREPGGFGLLDALCCKAGELLKQIKLNLGPCTWACAPNQPVGVSAALIRRIAFWTSVLKGPATFRDHIGRADDDLRDAGLPLN